MDKTWTTFTIKIPVNEPSNCSCFKQQQPVASKRLDAQKIIKLFFSFSQIIWWMQNQQWLLLFQVTVFNVVGTLIWLVLCWNNHLLRWIVGPIVINPEYLHDTSDMKICQWIPSNLLWLYSNYYLSLHMVQRYHWSIRFKLNHSSQFILCKS